MYCSLLVDPDENPILISNDCSVTSDTVCSNTLGRYECVCKGGFHRDSIDKSVERSVLSLS